ncbi:MAG: hypothetical protein JXR60_04700 [Bacteroidales bacterium]|nr:hypothetical protein [Bacteroidales bacterium]
MKFVGFLLEDVAGIQVYYIIGLLIFISFFIIILYRTLKMPKSEAESIKNSLFNDDEKEENNASSEDLKSSNN